MATITKQAIQQVSNSYGGVPAPRTYPEGASQSFVAGEIVYMESGYLTEIASNTPAAIIGVAAQDAHNDASAVANAVECDVNLAAPGIIFAGNVLGAAAADLVLLPSHLGRVMGIQRVTADSKVYLDASVTGGANARVFVHAIARGSAMGDTNARVLFEFLPKFTQFGATS